MRLIKAFFAGATALFVIITLFSLLIPSRVRISRVVLINNTGPAEIFREIANLENWKKWHPVFTIDSAEIYRNPAIAGENTGYSIIHHGKKALIRLLSADSASIKFLLQSEGENDIDNNIVIARLPSQQSVQVEWRAITKLHWYPWEKFYGIFIDKLTGPGYEAALSGLKDFIEKIPPSSPAAGKP